MIINAHGFAKIAQAYMKAKETLSVGDFVYIHWPKHLWIDVYRRSESEFDLTIHGAKKSDIVRLTAELENLIHDAA